MSRPTQRVAPTLEAVERVMQSAAPQTLRASTVANKLGCDWNDAAWVLRQGVRQGRILAVKVKKHTRYSWAGMGGLANA